jgi:hypothetical protein
VQELSAQVGTLKAQQESMQAVSAALRKELDATKSQLLAFSAPPGGVASAQAGPAAAPSASTTEERLSKVEENQQLQDAKISEQSQTKVESSSKYRVRLSGIVLLNMYANRGTVENQDFAQLATPGTALSYKGTFGGTLRQSQIGIQGFGPTVAGAHTSADIQFDFAGGFPQVPNGVSFGLARLRTGTIRFDWRIPEISGVGCHKFEWNTASLFRTIHLCRYKEGFSIPCPAMCLPQITIDILPGGNLPDSPPMPRGWPGQEKSMAKK